MFTDSMQQLKSIDSCKLFCEVKMLDGKQYRQNPVIIHRIHIFRIGLELACNAGILLGNIIKRDK